jgi:hypothetical protein
MTDIERGLLASGGTLRVGIVIGLRYLLSGRLAAKTRANFTA